MKRATQTYGERFNACKMQISGVECREFLVDPNYLYNGCS